MKKIFKCEALGDTLYFYAADQMEARKKLDELCGEIPDDLITWTEVNRVSGNVEIF